MSTTTLTVAPACEVSQVIEGINTSEGDDHQWAAWERYCWRLQEERHRLQEEYKALLREAHEATAALSEALATDPSPKKARGGERKAPPPGPWFTTHEAAQIARIGWSTLQRAVAEGTLKASNVGSAFRPRFRIHQHDLDKWVEMGGK